MKIHTTIDKENEVEGLLNTLNIPFTRKRENEKMDDGIYITNIGNERKNPLTYIHYDIGSLPEIYTFNEEWSFTHVLFTIKKEDWNNLTQETKDLIGKPKSGTFIYWKDYEKKDIDFELPIETTKPRYPIYIISYNRYEKMITMKYLEEMKTPYYIVVKNEDQYEKYKKSLVDKKFEYYTLLKVDDDFMKKQEILGNSGGIPQRNFCWEHSKLNSFNSHWIIDDNIKGFYMYNFDSKKRLDNCSFFSLMEDFRDDIVEPIGLLSPNYTNDVKSYRPPYRMNTKNYSCILVNNKVLDDMGIKWRKTYNEDVRLMLECLENGIRCIGMNMFLINKMSTGSVKGGNCDIYEYERPTRPVIKNKDFYKRKEVFEKKIIDICLEEDFQLQYENLWKTEGVDFVFYRGFMNKFVEIYRDYPEYIKYKTTHKDKRPHHRINTDKFKYGDMGLITFK